MRLKGIKEDPPRSGRYVIRFRGPTGSYHREWVDGLEEAMRRYEERVQQVHDGTFDPESIGRWSASKRPSQRRANAPRLVADVIDEVMVEVEATMRSARTFRSQAAEWKRELAGRTLDELTVEDVLRWRRRRLEGGASNATCNRYVAFLRRSISHAVSCGYIQQNPIASSTHRVRDLPESPDEDRVLTLDEQARLQRVMRPRAFLIVCLAIETGMRLGNIAACRREWINLERAFIRIPASAYKTKRVTLVRLNSVAVDILRVLLEWSEGSAWLLPAGRGTGPMSKNSFSWRTWTQALRKAGIPHLRFHDLRGTMVTRMLEAGATLEEVRLQGGWANYRMVQRYARIVESHRHEVSERAAAGSRSLLRGIGSDSGSENVVEFRKRKRQ